MTTINKLSDAGPLSSSDSIPIWSSGSSDTRRVTMGAVEEWLYTAVKPLFTPSLDQASAFANASATSAASSENSAANSETSALDASASAASAAESAASSENSAANSETSALDASASAASAAASASLAAVVNSAGDPYANAYASALPKGVLSTTITAGGSGGTTGTYALGISGGPTGFAGTYTISGGAVTAITITNPGLSTASTAPTLSFPSGSVTGATATATVGSLVLDQKTYWVASADSSQVLLYGNNGGSVATAPFGGTQLVMYGKAGVDAVAEKLVTISDRSGYLGGWQTPSGLLGLGFRNSDLRPIFGNGGDVVTRIEAAEAVFETVATGRSGILGAFKLTNGQLPWYVSAIDGTFWQEGRRLTSEVDALASRVTSVENGTTVPAGTTDIVAIGDSMTALGSGIMDVLPTKFPTRAVAASAEGGENTPGIAVSFGVPGILTLAITGNALPTTGTVTCTPNITFLNSGQCARVEVSDETGTAVACWVSNSGGTYSIRPASYPASAVKVQNPARARVVSLQATGTDPSAAVALSTLYGRTAIIRCGRNDIGWSRSYNGAQTVTYIQQIAALMTSGRYIILGPTNGTSDVPTAAGGSSADSAANCQITLDNCIDLNSRLAAAFPGRYWSVIANMRANSGTSSFTVNGSAYTVVNDTVLGDGIHENSTGKGLTGDLCVAAFAAKGY